MANKQGGVHICALTPQHRRAWSQRRNQSFKLSPLAGVWNQVALVQQHQIGKASLVLKQLRKLAQAVQGIVRIDQRHYRIRLYGRIKAQRIDGKANLRGLGYAARLDQDMRRSLRQASTTAQLQQSLTKI